MAYDNDVAICIVHYRTWSRLQDPGELITPRGIQVTLALFQLVSNLT